MVTWHLPTNALGGQHCKKCDFKWETVHFYPQNPDCCYTWSECSVERVLMLLLESHPIFQICFKFIFPLVLTFCYMTNHLMTGALENSEYCSLWISMFPLMKHWHSLETKCTISLRISYKVLDVGVLNIFPWNLLSSWNVCQRCAWNLKPFGVNRNRIGIHQTRNRITNLVFLVFTASYECLFFPFDSWHRGFPLGP